MTVQWPFEGPLVELNMPCVCTSGQVKNEIVAVILLKNKLCTVMLNGALCKKLFIIIQENNCEVCHNEVMQQVSIVNYQPH